MARVRVARVGDLPKGKLKYVEAEGKAICLANVEGKFYAIGNACHHRGGPLAEGELQGNVITCPWHGSKWDVTTGKLVWFPSPLQPMERYEVTVEGEEVYVEV